MKGTLVPFQAGLRTASKVVHSYGVVRTISKPLTQPPWQLHCNCRTINTSATRTAAKKQGAQIKSNTAVPKNTYAPPERLALPERLLVYNAGTGKTTFLAAVKVTSVFNFAASCLILAPGFYMSPDEPLWKTAVAISYGIIPMLFVGIVTTPFVNAVYLYLPRFARQSKEALMRYASKLPKDARLEFVTVRLIGAPKTTGMRFSELRARNDGFSILKPFAFANLERMSAPIQKSIWGKLFGWIREPRNKFYVKINDQEGMKRSMAPGVWENVHKQIQRQS